MAKVVISNSMKKAAAAAMFNASEWTPVGDPISLKDLWSVTNPGLYEDIDGEKAEVIAKYFEGSDDPSLRISLNFKNGSKIELRLGKGDYEEGDEVLVSSIEAQELRKAGSENIVRFQAQVI